MFGVFFLTKVTRKRLKNPGNSDVTTYFYGPIDQSGSGTRVPLTEPRTERSVRDTPIPTPTVRALHYGDGIQVGPEVSRPVPVVR